MRHMLIGLAVILCVGVARALWAAGPSTADLDSDIRSTRAEIVDAEADASKYSGGAILAEIRLREMVLKNTLAMLEQKQTAFMRGINITYRDQTPRLPCLTDDSSAQADLKQVTAEADAAHEEAAQYSGGLVKVMALIREATARATVAADEQRIAFMKLGVALPSLAADKPPPSAGRPSSDKDAL